MALPKMLGDREVQKFMETSAGEVAVRTAPTVITSSDGNEMAVNDSNQAKMRDDSAISALNIIIDKLECIEFQLKLITGA
jgi:hypothetical protein